MFDETACRVCGCTNDGCYCCLKHTGMPMMAGKGVVIGRDTELDMAFIMDAMFGAARAALLECRATPMDRTSPRSRTPPLR